MWRQLAPLLTTRRGWTGARPPVALEWVAGAGRLRVGLWCSKTVGLGAVREAICTAWPGAQVTETAPPELLAFGHGRADRRRPVRCAVARPATPHWYPLATDAAHGTAGDISTDPLRGLLAALTGAPDGTTAVLQVLVQPASPRVLRRARRAVRALRHGDQTRPGIAGLLTVTPPSGRAGMRGTADPIALADARTAIAKLTDTPLFEVSLRVGLAAAEPARASRVTATAWTRQVAAALGLFAGRQHLVLGSGWRLRRGIRLRVPGWGFLASVHELASLAHLPAEPSRYGMSLAAARGVTPPAGLADA